MLTDPAMAEVRDDTEAGRESSVLDPVLWEPPDSAEIIMEPAQWESPLAPFVFLGGVLHTGASFESGREFRIGNQAVINTHGDTVLQLSGPISSYAGSRESLVKLGAGTLVLSGANTYNGNTQLLQGGLDVAGNSALGAGSRTLNVNTGTRLRYAPGIVVGNGVQMETADIGLQVPAGSYTPVVPSEYADSVQWRVDTGEAMQTGPLAGSAPIVKQGAGLLRLLGPAMAYTGLFTVNQGALAVDGVFWGPVRVNSGARLQGVGQVGSTTVMPGGTLAPGNSVGALTVQGDLRFMPGARFEVEATPQGQADSVQVTGTAQLDGQVLALAQAGDWQANTQYAVLRAGQGLGATRFASVETDLAFLTPSLSYDDTQVVLTLARNDTDFEDVTDTPNQEEVAQDLDDEPAVDPVRPGRPSLPEQVVQLDGDQARQAFEQLSGSWAASVQSSLQDDSRFIRQAVLRHVNPFAPDSLGLAGDWADSLIGSASGASPNTARAWSQAFYSSADRSAYGGVAADARDIGGMALGLSRPLGADWSVGAFFGAQHSRLRRDESVADASIDSTHAGLDLAGRWRGALLTVGAVHSWHAIRSQRRVSAGSLRDALSSDYRAQSTQVFGEASVPFAPVASAPAITLEPFARLAWLHTHMQGFTESGGAAALQVMPASPSTWLSALGLKFTQAIQTVRGAARLQARLAWRYAGGSVLSVARQRFRNSVNQAIFSSEGQPLARNAWLFELGLQARLARTVRLGLGYAGQFARGMQDHGARVDLAWVF